MIHLKDIGICGGNIEGAEPAKFGKLWLNTVTILDLPVRKGSCISKVNGRDLENFEDISQEHVSNPSFGLLKESVIREFSSEKFFKIQVLVILYYLNTFPKNFHIHVHRGKNMGTIHINLLQSYLKEKISIEVLDENVWLVNKRTKLTFGFGYQHDQLDPKLENVDIYYSIL